MINEESCIEVASGTAINPSCPHGPTLLFSRKFKKGFRKFFACSACRDRKLCNFFLWADEILSDERKKAWEIECLKFIGGQNHEEMYSFVHKLRPYFLRNEVSYCHTCSIFLLNIYTSDHKNHDLTRNVPICSLKHPTELIKPLECDKKEAQYFFSKESVNTIINIALKNNVKSVICIGAPRIHEYILTSNFALDSILLDFDRRYHMFYEPQEFCWYNSFNNYFFLGSKAKQCFEKFLCRNNGQDFMIILDPPFGGRLEPLGISISEILKLHKQLNSVDYDVPVLLIYPYFMEHHVIRCFPTFKMVDYKVSYDNHPAFSHVPKAAKLGSPVRIFTNLSLNKVILPYEGYRFCAICDCWVSSENKHCKFCGKCTSKNGSTYKHCFKCQMCVKPSWNHCEKCKRCSFDTHSCKNFKQSLHFNKCFPCGEESRGSSNCQDDDPRQVLNITGSHKRRLDLNKPNRKKKKKKKI